MIDKPQIVRTTAQETAVIRLTVPWAEIQNVMGPGYDEVTTVVNEQGIAAGPWYTYHYRMDPEVIDYEIGVPVTKPVSPVGRVKPGQLPAATVARTVYHGPYEGLPAAWEEFMAWVAAEGHTPGPDLWEVYQVGPESSGDPSAWRTELNRPLAK